MKKVFRDVFKSYELTQAGKNLLDQYEKKNTFLPLQCRAENIQFRADIVHMPTVPVDWKKIQMHNWVQYNSQIDEVRVRINMGKNPTIEFLPSPVEGDDPFQYIHYHGFRVCKCNFKAVGNNRPQGRPASTRVPWRMASL